MITATEINKKPWLRWGIVLLPFLMLALALLFGRWVLTAQAEVAAPTQVCTVNTAGTGTHPDIQAAVNDPNCHNVYIAAGYYTEIITFTQNVTVTGAGINLTTIFGDNQGSVFKCGSESVADPTLVVKLANMKIQGGAADKGGGIFNGFTCRLTGYNLEVSANSAATYGGGIHNAGVMTITRSSIAGNIALIGAGVNSGGGVNTLLIMSDTDVSGNYATGPGGGMYIISPAELTNINCASNGSDVDAGGIFAGSALNTTLITPITISESVIQDNIAEGTGGIVVNNHVTIDASEIISNTGGRTDTPGASVYGGGIGIRNIGVLTLTNSTVSNNSLDPLDGSVAAYGGGIHVGGLDNRLWMLNTTVSNNEPGGVVDSRDAVLFSSTAVVDIKNSAIFANIGAGIRGKGTLTVINSPIYANTWAGIAYECTVSCGGSSGIVTVKHSSIRMNGGFGLSGNDVTLKHSTVRDNTGYGVSGDDVYMQYSTISGHSSADEGGGVTGENLDIHASAIYNNHSDADGGGIYATGVLTVVNSTVSGNTTNGSGGGIALDGSGGVADLDSVTVVSNTVDLDADNTGDGGGIYRDAAAGTFSVRNSIIANNQDDSPIALAKERDCFGDFSGGWSLVEVYDNNHCTGFGSATNTNGVDPQVDPLADNGGPTLTHALDAGSPAVNHTLGTLCLNNDQRGVDRDTASMCDAGAYERGTCAAPIIPTLTIVADGNHIQLDWDQHNENHEVEIWRGTNPFAGNTFSNIWTNLRAFTTYIDYDAIGNPLTNYFYAVRGQNACGATTVISNIVGEFDFRLAAAEAAEVFAATSPQRFLHFALISLPLEGADLPVTADGVADYIDPDGSIKGVAKWNPLTRSWVVRRVGSPFGTLDFAVAPGDVLLLGMTQHAPDSFAWVGDVPAAGSIQNNLTQDTANFVIVPLDQSGAFTMLADGLAADIGDVSRVWGWNTAQQRWYMRIVGTSGLNFPIRLGYPYGVLAGPTTPQVWP